MIVETAATWEILFAGLVAVLVIFLFRPGIKAALVQSRTAQKDWKGVLIPLGLVVLFVILLMNLV
jgi:threonine/homoserine/homoserine lactone efflux protein